MGLEQTLAGWTGPSSTTEQEKQERTERMIREAINAHPAFAHCSKQIYAKGSYPNNTNVRTDSDVDVAVQCSEVVYWEEHESGAHPSAPTYTGPWTPEKLRSEVVAALRTKFGDQVDTSGTTAIRVSSSAARVEADVVPCFDFLEYFAGGSTRAGTRIFRKTGASFENYPVQHLAKGRAKNTAANGRFKSVVRILKRVENAMVVGNVHREVPSFFVECLVFNCPNSLFQGTWTEQVRKVLFHIWDSTQGDIEPDDGRWSEVNEVKYLFHHSQAWTRKDGRDFANAAWNHLGFE